MDYIIIVVLVIIWYTINEWYVIFYFRKWYPVGDGDTISGLENGELDSKVQWTLPYEDSLVQPVRAVLDVNMGEYASGTR